MEQAVTERSSNGQSEPPLHSSYSIPENFRIEAVLKILDQSDWLNMEEFLNPWGEQRVTLAHLAAHRGNIGILKQAVDLEVDLDATDYLGRCALHHAADQGHVDVVNWLLKYSARRGEELTGSQSSSQLSLEDSDGMTALHLAEAAEHEDVVKVLVKAHLEEAVRISDGRKKMEAREFLRSPWNVQQSHLAAYSGDLEELKRAGDPDAMDKFGRRPLHYAAIQGHMDVIKYLLERPEAVPADLETTDRFGMTALHYAADQGHIHVMKYLLGIPTVLDRKPIEVGDMYKEFGDRDALCIEEEEKEKEEDNFHANILIGRSSSKKDEEKGEVFRRKFVPTVPGGRPSENKSCWLQFRDNLGRTPLHSAVKENSVDVVKCLVDCGANINACDAEGLPPIFLAHCNVNISNNHGLAHYEDIIDILVSAGASVDGVHPITGWNVLHYAVLLNSAKATQRLSKYDSTLILRGEQSTGDTPLHLAAACGSNEALCILLKMLRSSLIDTTNKKGWTPLHSAAFAGNLQSVCALIDKGGNLAKKNFEGNTTIDYLVRLKDNVDLGAFFTNIFDKNVHTALKKNHAAMLGEFVFASLDFKVLAPEGEDVPQMAMLSALMERLPRKDQIPILQHPLPQAYISKKWSHLRWVFYSLVFIQVLFTVDISFYAVYLRKDSVASILRRMLFFFAGIPLCWNFLQSLAEPKIYFRQLENWLSLFSLTISISVAVVGEFVPNPTNSFIPYSISFVIPLIWIRTMLSIGRFSGGAFYALIFRTILENFAKIFVIGLSIIVGFAISFMILSHSKDAIADFWPAVLKTVVMMTGEYDYADLFSNDTEPMADNHDANRIEKFAVSPINSIVFLMFVMLAGIALMNLMIGPVVSDVQRLSQEGRFSRLLKQAQFIANCERMTESRIPLGDNLTHKLRSTIGRTLFWKSDRPPGYYKHLMEDVLNLDLRMRN